jgi:hypothetical protein
LSLLILFILAFVVACERSAPESILRPGEHVAHLQIAADSIDCVSAQLTQRCLEARELVGGDVWDAWQPFFATIDGFVHEPGFIYDVQVARRQVENPPVDASSYVYRLLSVLRKAEATP